MQTRFTEIYKKKHKRKAKKKQKLSEQASLDLRDHGVYGGTTEYYAKHPGTSPKTSPKKEEHNPVDHPMDPPEASPKDSPKKEEHGGFALRRSIPEASPKKEEPVDIKMGTYQMHLRTLLPRKKHLQKRRIDTYQMHLRSLLPREKHLQKSRIAHEMFDDMMIEPIVGEIVEESHIDEGWHHNNEIYERIIARRMAAHDTWLEGDRRGFGSLWDHKYDTIMHAQQNDLIPRRSFLPFDIMDWKNPNYGGNDNIFGSYDYNRGWINRRDYRGDLPFDPIWDEKDLWTARNIIDNVYFHANKNIIAKDYIDRRHATKMTLDNPGDLATYLHMIKARKKKPKDINMNTYQMHLRTLLPREKHLQKSRIAHEMVDDMMDESIIESFIEGDLTHLTHVLREYYEEAGMGVTPWNYPWSHKFLTIQYAQYQNLIPRHLFLPPDIENPPDSWGIRSHDQFLIKTIPIIDKLYRKTIKYLSKLNVKDYMDRIGGEPELIAAVQYQANKNISERRVKDFMELKHAQKMTLDNPGDLAAYLHMIKARRLRLKKPR